MTSIMGEFVELRPQATPGNLTRKNTAALRNLRCNDDIIIKPVDKGIAIVIWGKSDYIAEASRQLLDPITYQQDNEDKTNQCNEDVRSFVCNGWAQGIINQETCEYLIVKKPSLGRFYLLPKIHKNKTPCPRRPIVSGSGSCTEGISCYVDKCLKGFIEKVPAHLHDTIHF
uniref:C2H2-type domain-containing protein n=1 Tax=Latimeria chalumnae TaxID=7897 RepID=H2ZRS4_LATCH